MAGLLLAPLVLLPVLVQLQAAALVTPQFSIADLLRLLAAVLTFMLAG